MCLHGSFGSVALTVMRWDVRFVQIFVLAAARRIAAAAAVTAAFQASEATTAARHSTAAASNDAPHDG